MKLVIPVSLSDAHLLPLFTDALVKLGHVGPHSLLLVPTPAVSDAAQGQVNRLRTICDDVQLVATPVDFQGGWPAGPNNHWHWVVTYLDSVKLREPWLWMELDAVPLKPRWASLLAEAYFGANKSFFGFTKPVKYIRREDGAMYHKPGDDFLLGVAIYPPGITGDTHIRPLFNNLGRRVPMALKEPFDMYLRWVMKQRGVHSTTLITDLWRTCNYREEGGQIVCDPVAGETYARGGTVPAEAILVHGCRDGSLHRLIGAEKPVAFVSGSETKGYKPVGEAATPPKTLSGAPTDEEVLTFVSTNKVRAKEVQERFGFTELPDVVRAIQAVGYHVGTAGWVLKKEVAK